MIDPTLLRENPELVKRSQEARGEPVSTVDDAVAADRERRAAITAFEELRAAQNAYGKRVAQAPKDEKAALVAEAKALSDQVKAAQHAVTAAEEAADAALAHIENIVIEGVPAGGEDDFVDSAHARRGARRSTSSRATTSSSARCSTRSTWSAARRCRAAASTSCTGIGARLEIALMILALDRALQAGFMPLIPPTLVRPEVMRGTGFLGEHADEVYHLEDDDLYLVGTSEVPLAGYHKDEIIDLSGGAMRYAGWSTCYRREAGSYGKDTRGIIRVHQFNKLEMFVYTTPDDAEAEHLRLVALQEGMLQDARALATASSTSPPATWDRARRASTTSRRGCRRRARSVSSPRPRTARRTRRGGSTSATALRSTAGGIGKTQHVATLNGTLATTRWIVAMLETHQRADGSVVVPEVLRPYLGGLEVLEPVA